mmetsp:Transcript_27120/g.46048  ORF Transcript_27120/g.46048 Transcript_27120/m.46048 type:complete len:217 (+) Transcript_27120:91-741(+)
MSDRHHSDGPSDKVFSATSVHNLAWCLLFSSRNTNRQFTSCKSRKAVKVSKLLMTSAHKSSMLSFAINSERRRGSHITRIAVMSAQGPDMCGNLDLSRSIMSSGPLRLLNILQCSLPLFRNTPRASSTSERCSFRGSVRYGIIRSSKEQLKPAIRSATAASVTMQYTSVREALGAVFSSCVSTADTSWSMSCSCILECMDNLVSTNSTSSACVASS